MNLKRYSDTAKDYKPAIYYLIIANALIIIGAGHGIGCMGLIEISLFPYVNEENFSFAVSSNYDYNLPAAALFSAVGTILLSVSLGINTSLTKFICRLIAVLLLWIGFFYLCYSFKTSAVAGMSFFTGIPFLILSALLFIQTITAYRHSKNNRSV